MKLHNLAEHSATLKFKTQYKAKLGNLISIPEF